MEAPEVEAMDNKYCHDCIYFGGATECSCTCNYIFMEDKKRPCNPGNECTVRIKRRRKRRMAGGDG